MYRHRNNEFEMCIDVVQFRVISATEGRVDFELDIQKEHTNRLQTLHGGTLASLVDLGGSLAVASSGRFATGVSTDLNAPEAAQETSSRALPLSTRLARHLLSRR
ncbi:hypothetical protein FOYG_09369 [Fusarium oxysporum NRRL 32931]|uniref:Thioesterase domain-containing protein n=1 Tax=Fusarium oxysporum NRRL 32931 TaxID=660029 RepID=W9HZI3_FUSOX|nr:hypothetical protein FOYG_09369 [Fusarium oxysporum NRRL 32931]